MREILIYSTTVNGEGKVLFKKSFQDNPSTPAIGSVVPPGCIMQNYGQLKQGTITDVKTSPKSTRIWVATATHTSDLREILIPEGWKEVAKG